MAASYTVKQIAKAILACAIAFVGALVAGASDNHLTLLEWLIAVGAGLAALGGVFRISNAGRD